MLGREQVLFDAACHSADAIQRAAYKFCKSFSLELVRDGDRFRCSLSPIDNPVVSPFLIDQFRVEVLDQVLRERIRNETAAVRNLILALAFSKAQLDTD